MPVGRLDIGTGVGGAQVFGQNPAIQQFGEILAQRKQKRDAENAYINDQLATNYDPGSLRNEADKSAYIDKYNSIKTAAIDAENEKNDKLKALKIAQIRQQIGDLKAWGEGSKKLGSQERDFLKAYQKNPDKWSDDALDKFRTSQKSVWDGNDAIKDWTDLQQNIDPTKINKEEAENERLMLAKQQWGKPTITKLRGPDGRLEQQVINQRSVSPQLLYESRLNRVHTDKQFRQFMKQSYPELYRNHDEDTANALAVKLYTDARPQVSEVDKPQIDKGQEPVRFSALELYNLRRYGNPNAPSKTQPGLPAEPVQDFPIQYNTNADNGGFQIHAKNFVPLTEANKTFAGAPDIDINNGGAVNPKSAAIEGKIAGVGDFPVFNKNFGSIKKGTPAAADIDPKNVDYRRMVLIQKDITGQEPQQYLLDYDKLPANIKNSKAVKEALIKFNTTPVGGSGGGGLKKIGSQAEYDALPKGAQYIAPDGQTYTKQ